MQKLVHQIYSFDKFTLDVTRGCVLHESKEIKLRPKSFEVLKFLVENNGRLITKDELIQAVWVETAVTDDSLVQCLKDIRHALGDEAQQIIKTVPRRGYIFEKEVNDNGSTIYTEETTGVHIVIEETEERNNPNVIETSMTRSGSFAPLNANEINEQILGKNRVVQDTPVESTIVNLSNTIKQHQRAAIITLVAIIIFVGVIVWRFNSNKKKAENSPPMSAVLFQNVKVKNITHIGNVVNNAISPDGRYVVFTMSDAKGESLWLRQLATDSTQQVLAPEDVRFFGVSFSRDGEYIYFLRSARANPYPRMLFRIPTLGGVTEKVLWDMNWCPTFSPDGSQMAFVRNTPADNDSRLMIANTDGTGERTIAVRPLNEAYSFPAWSPDGQTIAATAGSAELGDSFRDVVTVNISDGAEKTLTLRKWYWITQAAWLADGSGLIMSANPKKGYFFTQLWLLSYPNGETRQITNDSNNYDYISLTADSRTLLAHHVELLTHIWIAPEGDSARARRISSGLGDYKHIRWTPDGNLTVAAFGNNNLDIFLRNTNGGEIKQLTVNTGTNWGNEPSDDGRYIVFDSDRTGEFHIWRMDADGANPVQLTNGTGEKFAEISPDGKWVVYTSFQDWTLWKISIEGGEPVKIADAYARQSSISPDGKWIVYMASENNRQIVMSFEGDAPVRTYDLPPDAPQLQSVRWSPDSQAIQFIVKRGGVENIWQMPLDGGEAKQITNFTSDRIFSYDWSPNGKQLAIIRGAWTADMVLITQK